MEKYYLRIITLETCCRERKEKMYKKGTQKNIFISFIT